MENQSDFSKMKINISLEQLAKYNRIKGNEYQMKKINEQISKNQKLITNQVYQRKQTRNIKQMLMEWSKFNNKLNSQNSEKQYKKAQMLKIRHNKLRYDDNELMQFNYSIDKVKSPLQKKNYLSEQKFKSKNRPQYISFDIGNEKKEQFRSTNSNQFSNMVSKKSNKKINKRYTVTQKNNEVSNQKKKRISELPNLKMKHNLSEETTHFKRRVNTVQNELQYHRKPAIKIQLFSNDTKNEKIIESPKNSHHNNQNDNIIQITQQKMQKYVRNLHKISYQYAFYQNPLQQLDENKLIELQRYMRKFKFNEDRSLSEKAINIMVSRRYNLLDRKLLDKYTENQAKNKKQEQKHNQNKFIDTKKYKILNSLSKNSMLQLIKGDKQNLKKLMADQQQPQDFEAKYMREHQFQINFYLPFSQFISFKETKVSIHRILNMSAKNTLRVAFSIFDKNHNNLIDGDDLIQLINLSKKISFLQSDVINLMEEMILQQSEEDNESIDYNTLKRSDNKSKIKNKVMNLSPRNIKKFSKTITRTITDSIGQFQEFLQEQPRESKKFQKKKFFLFQEEKQQVLKAIRTKNKRETFRFKNRTFTIKKLNFTEFCECFNNRRCALIFDLFYYLFKVTEEEMNELGQKEYRKCLEEQSIIQITKKRMRKEEKTQINEDPSLESQWNQRLVKVNKVMMGMMKQIQVVKR